MLRVACEPDRGEALARTFFKSITASAIFCMLFCHPVLAQARLANLDSDAEFAGVITISEEAKTLLSRAEEGMERKDWKLVVDSLQRIIELQGEHVLTSDDQTYESARRYAHRMVAQLPTQGLNAYRLLHDGEAEALLKRARDAHDARPLRTILDRYFCTSFGDEASLLLADWLIDEGQFAEASGILNTLRELHPDPEVSDFETTLRLAICAAGVGRQARAVALLQQVELLIENDAERIRSHSAEDLERRLEMIRTFADRGPDRRSVDHEHWPMKLGSAQRRNSMPPVEPNFVTHMPNVAELPLPELSHPAEVLQAFMRRKGLLPTRHVASDGRTLVVKGIERIVAVDIDSFSELWTSEPIINATRPVPEVTMQRFRTHPGSNVTEGDEELERDPDVWQLLYDNVASSVSVVDDMVLSIDWLYGAPPPLHMKHLGMWSGGPIVTGMDTVPNQVVAYSIRDGSILWKSGALIGDEEPAQPNLQMEFLSVPVPVGDALLAPARVNTDLYAIFLDTETGRIVRRVYLCGTGGGKFKTLHALEPCVSEGVAFIPTGRGLLFALDLNSGSMRWTVRYEGNPQAYMSSGWIPQPLVAVSDVVLVAPPDAHRLYCFSRTDGALRWDIPRGDMRYILAANDEQIWLVGKQVHRLDVETGQVLEKADLPEIAGRGALSGDRIYLPTREGIVRLDASTLERISVDQPRNSDPEGNLLAWNASLFSTGVFEVRRYVDVERGYERALARYEEDPDDLSRVISLGWMELQRYEPARALEVLKKVEAPTEGEGRQRYGLAVQLRVRAMLELAASGEVDDDEALTLLQEAREISQSPEDAILCIFALGEFYEMIDQPMRASLEYASLAMSDHGDQMVTQEGESGLERLARRDASLRIMDAAHAFEEKDREAFSSALRETYLLPAINTRDRGMLRRLAETTAMGEVSSEAELTLGKWMASASRFEQAEAHLRRVIRRDSSETIRAEAMGWLAAMYLFPSDFHLPVQASALLDDLEQSYADTEMTESILFLHDLATGEVSENDLPETRLPGRELVERLRARIDAGIMKKHITSLGPYAFGRPDDPLARNLTQGRPMAVRGPRVEAMADLVLMLIDEKEIEAHDADTWSVRWPAKLRLLGEMAVEPDLSMRQTDSARAQQHRQKMLTLAHGVVEGQTLIVNSDYGLHAIGLLTGRRLWSRPYVAPTVEQLHRAASDRAIWAKGGYVISVDARGKLEVALVDEGHQVLWRAAMPMQRWHRVLSRGDYVVAADENLKHLDVFQLQDGRRLGQCVFAQDDVDDGPLSVSVFEEVVCGPGSTNEVVAYELSRPGIERWRESMPEGLTRIFKPAPDLLGVADAYGRIKILDPATGKLQLETRIERGRGGVFSGAVEADVLYVAGFEDLPAERAQVDQQQWYVAAIDMRSGEQLWLAPGYTGSSRHMTTELFTAATNAIPVTQFVAAGRDSSNDLIGELELILLDKKTGKPLGEAQSKKITREGNARWILDVQCWEDKIMVRTGGSVVVFPLEKASSLKESESARAAARLENAG